MPRNLAITRDEAEQLVDVLEQRCSMAPWALSLADETRELFGMDKRSDRPVLVFTNGCFDVLHIGHISLLQRARRLGTKLLVGLNSDDSVRWLKGRSRPINNHRDRKAMLMAMQSVTDVLVFDDPRCSNLIRDLKPDIYVKAGYKLEDLDPSEYAALTECGTEIKLLPLVDGYSTTAILEKLKR